MRFPISLRSTTLLIGLILASVTQSAAANPPGLRAVVQSQIPATEVIRAVAMLDEVPSESQVDALRALGLQAQGLKHLPMILTKGPVATLRQLVEQGQVRDIYLDKQLEWHSQESTAAMSADLTRQMGFDGSGITVAVVDSGIDASHPDLENRVVRNVRVYSPEYLEILGVHEPLGITWPSSPALVLPFDMLPYNNTDTIGHGTHVAGIVAGEGVGDGELVGVAPGAEIVGYSTGEILFIFTALASFDDILATHEEYGIKVINNSWGSRFHVFDPDSPINVATKALTDAGMTVIFSAGNDGVEMTTNVHSMAPWVTMSGSATISREKSDFSSSGLMFDNSRSQPVVDGHVRHEGDGLGISHPDVSAPGSDIISTCTPTGAIVCGAVAPGGSSSSSGTSMSAPHMAGLAAILLQANPELTPNMVRQVMQLTADPMRDGAEVWRSGFGFVNAKSAIDLVTSADFDGAALDALEQEQIAAAMQARSHEVVVQDQWEFISIGATAMGLESYDFDLPVSAKTTAIHASVAFPADVGALGLNLLFEWGLELVDPDGNVVATTELVNNLGFLKFDLLEAGMTPAEGNWIVRAIGFTHISQPGFLWGHSVTVVATQIKQNENASVPSAPSFEVDGKLSFFMTGGGGPLSSPEACSYDPQGASGQLAHEPQTESCQAGTVGYAVNFGLGVPAEFISAPLQTDATVGGVASLTTYLVSELYPIYSVAFGSSLDYQIDAVDAAGELLISVAGGSLTPMVGPTPTLGALNFDIPTTTLPAGSRLRLRMSFTGVYTSSMRLVWGGEFSDAGLSLQTGSLQSRSVTEVVKQPTAAVTPRGGAMQPVPLLLILGMLAVRRRPWAG